MNHSLNFKGPLTGAQTNAIESSWRAAKAIVSSSERKKSNIPENLARYIFYKRCKELKLNKSEEFFRIAGILYNPKTVNIVIENFEKNQKILIRIN